MEHKVSQTQDISLPLQEQVTQAIAKKTPLRIRGGGSKDFYGRSPTGDYIEVNAHRGIISYEPTELVITARAGTPLNEIEQVLAEQHQLLAFEPPAFGDSATLGGTVACNLSGPRRPYAGAARDFVLGTKLLNGKGEILSFGGEVMKNVAGYDVSRLMAGAMGTLGILLEVSLKVLPKPEQEITLVHEGLSAQDALDRLQTLSRQPLAISAGSYFQGRLAIRLCGTCRGVESAREKVGGDTMDATTTARFWSQLKNHQHTFFQNERPLWRFSVAANDPPLPVDGEWLYDWGGAQRWIHTDEPVEQLFQIAADAGGHASAYRNPANRDTVFQPLAPGLLPLHHQLKQAFDPYGIFNPGRMYPDY